ncbi:hypothetical protein [Cohnella abietis]|uniref:Uncharacterized protein n=1 Tax=Cohnella abietis TaxID=2507935 RepID=A0A3T1D2D7_9BACL|nr:hypothetical protein [Cohnella abietis]BBI32165.1 hypothetical protein KCTCHS21_15640 [Cohnella abietis]
MLEWGVGLLVNRGFSIVTFFGPDGLLVNCGFSIVNFYGLDEVIRDPWAREGWPSAQLAATAKKLLIITYGAASLYVKSVAYLP